MYREISSRRVYICHSDKNFTQEGFFRGGKRSCATTLRAPIHVVSRARASFIGLGGLSAAECALRASGVAPEDLLMFVASFGAL